MANALTVGRIVLGLALLMPRALSPGFLVLYALAGITDMLDGPIARRTGTESELGARLDSVADLILVVVSLAKILPAIDVPMWLGLWVALIAAIKITSMASGYVREGCLVMPHTTANKLAGLMIFLVPFALPFVDIAVLAVPACTVATFAAIQEGHLIRSRGQLA